MRVAVITPYFRESQDVLRACHNGVLRQTHPCTHFMVADGLGHSELSTWEVQHIILPKSHDDAGNTPRAIGSISAMNQGFDAIAYLDADNGFYTDHIERMVKLHQETGAAVCTSGRTIHRPDGSFMFQDPENDGRTHVDTSCFFFASKAFELLPKWAMMPRQLGPICDRVMWQLIRSLDLVCAHSGKATVAFRTQYEVHYQAIGETPPPGVKTNNASTIAAMEWWAMQPNPVQMEYMRRLGMNRW
jgi:hypothetical protein